MSIFSGIFPAMFLIWVFFLGSSPALAWNPDYAYDLPRQRRMCVRPDTPNTHHFFAIGPDQECPMGYHRYIVIFAREPRGAMAMLPAKTSVNFYPPLTLTWPAKEGQTRTNLWHFTCVEPKEREVLGSKVEMLKYHGEITSKAEQNCLDVQSRVLKYCKEELQGTALLEYCPLSWGI